MDQTRSLQNLALQVPQIYCVKCKTKTPNSEDIQLVKTKNNRNILTASCAVCGSRKRRFVSAKEGKGIADILKKIFEYFTKRPNTYVTTGYPGNYSTTKRYVPPGAGMDGPIDFGWTFVSNK